MKVSKHQGTTVLLLDEKGEVSLHLPVSSKAPPSRLEEFLVLLGLWETRHKELMKIIYSKTKTLKERREGKSKT